MWPLFIAVQYSIINSPVADTWVFNLSLKQRYSECRVLMHILESFKSITWWGVAGLPGCAQGQHRRTVFPTVILLFTLQQPRSRRVLIAPHPWQYLSILICPKGSTISEVEHLFRYCILHLVFFFWDMSSTQFSFGLFVFGVFISRVVCKTLF